MRLEVTLSHPFWQIQETDFSTNKIKAFSNKNLIKNQVTIRNKNDSVSR